MKRLYEIVYKSGKPQTPRVFAKDKTEAKLLRGDAAGPYMIVRGPDHMRFKGATSGGKE